MKFISSNREILPPDESLTKQLSRFVLRVCSEYHVFDMIGDKDWDITKYVDDMDLEHCRYVEACVVEDGVVTGVLLGCSAGATIALPGETVHLDSSEVFEIEDVTCIYVEATLIFLPEESEHE